ncbi:putative methyltransferase PMT27 [Hordeum vulgare]|nr:putative methyltransferase PMT27 [Hordeum vulgare]
MESSIQSMEQLLAENKYQVVGFDLEFISGRAGQDQKNLFNIRDHYKVLGSTNNKLNSLVDLASAIIDPDYMKMKDESKKDKNAWHSAWDQRRDEEHIKYMAKDVVPGIRDWMKNTSSTRPRTRTQSTRCTRGSLT